MTVYWSFVHLSSISKVSKALDCCSLVVFGDASGILQVQAY